jgi:hypothetical protein
VYSKQFIGKPWTATCKRTSNDKFYCSKIVYRGWLSRGIELEPHDNWNTILQFWRWNYRKKWGVKFWYPEFHWVTYKDAWVTPTDLDDDNNTERISTF